MQEDQTKVEESAKEQQPQEIDQQAAPAPSANPTPAPEAQTSPAPVGPSEAPEANPTDAAPVQPATQAEQDPTNPNPVEPQAKTFTQDEVNQLVGKARVEGRESAMKAYRERYGAETDDDLDGIFGNGEKFDDLSSQFGAQGKELQTLREENALLKATSESGLDPAKYEDVKAILAYQHMDLTPESIAQAMQTHPEWAKQNDVATAPGFQPVAPAPQPSPAAPIPPAQAPAQGPVPSVLSKLGNEPAPAPQEDEKTQAMRLMGINQPKQ